MALFLLFFFFRSGFIVGSDTGRLIGFSFDRFSLFVGSIFFVSLLMGLFPIRKGLNLGPSFLYFVAGGIGIILADNLLTFFLFWAFQRSLPCWRFLINLRRDGISVGGTYIVQHLLTSLCFLALVWLSFDAGYLNTSFSDIPFSFFKLPVLILAFIIIYESHGIFPFHSWVHDLVDNLKWYEISALFLSRGGVLLFVKFLMPTLNQDPDFYRTLLLSFSIFSSIYWTFIGIFETKVTKATTYFYIAQSSLILTALQADLTAARGAYLHLMVISLSGTALWSLLSYVQVHTSIKHFNQFYGLARFYPRLATLFCLFGFCMIGVPLGASFVVEDLVITGLLETHPFLGLGHILATCLNGILFFLVFSKIFLGRSPFVESPKNLDMGIGQMAPYVIILAIMIAIGIVPSIFLERIQW